MLPIVNKDKSTTRLMSILRLNRFFGSVILFLLDYTLLLRETGEYTSPEPRKNLLKNS